MYHPVKNSLNFCHLQWRGMVIQNVVVIRMLRFAMDSWRINLYLGTSLKQRQLNRFWRSGFLSISHHCFPSETP
jgi:hypothetical protein